MSVAVVYNKNGDICRIITVTGESDAKLDSDPAFFSDGGCQVRMSHADYAATSGDLLALYQATTPAIPTAKALKPVDPALATKAAAKQAALQAAKDAQAQQAQQDVQAQADAKVS